MFNYGEKFKELWDEIPTIISYDDYIKMANEIDNACTGEEITKKDEKTLLAALEVFWLYANIRNYNL